jgi:hypothetical protein
MFLPYAAFAGGLAVSRATSNRSITVRALILAAVSFALLAYVEPIARYHHRVERGVDVSRQFPLGPATPGTLLSLKEAIQASPPNTYRYSVDEPMEAPPNWVEHLLHGLLVLPLFSLLSALLGRQIGSLTTGLPPPARQNARWALGVLSGLAFFIALVVGDSWVRNDPSRSGALGAWGALLIPMLELGLLLWLSRYWDSRRDGFPVSAPK